jgi:hypothetical protein
MIHRLAEYVLKRGAELALALGLVAACYFAILATLTAAFPAGTSLRALVQERGSASTAHDATRELRWRGSAERHAEVATLSRKSNRVKDKSANSVAWGESLEGMKLGERHSIQTFARSLATIAFDADSRIDLGENSLVVLKSFDREAHGSSRRASLLVLGGEVRGSVGAGAAGLPLEVEMEAAQGTTRIRSEVDADAPAEFRMEVDESRSTARISLFGGTAEVSTGGTTIPLRANQMLELEPEGPAPTPIELPRAPQLRSPGERALSYRTQAPLVRFEWNAVAGAESYVLVIAKDPEFREVVYRTESPATELEFGNLEAGRYYWRVSTVADGLEGAPSAAGRVILRSDTEPPRLAVDWPDETVRGAEVEIRGRAEPGIHVFVANESVTVDAKGRFSRTITLERGANVIVVEGVDRVGNTAYESHVVNAEY